MAKIGKLGEDLVARWLKTQDWTILQTRWLTRSGEIDLIAEQKDLSVLAFVEVKTRSQGNWDANGLLKITPKKQLKLWHTAEVFLSRYPNFYEYTCRFDVALVSYTADFSGSNCEIDKFNLGHPVIWQGYKFILVDYLESAFDSVRLN